MGHNNKILVVAVTCTAVVFGLALVSAVVSNQNVILLTRVQLDKVVPGCKWWYCSKTPAQSQAVVQSSQYHPGYSITETDSLSNSERRAIEPAVTRLVGAYETDYQPVQRPAIEASERGDGDLPDLPISNRVTGAGDDEADSAADEQSSGDPEASAAAYAAVHNLAVSLVPTSSGLGAVAWQVQPQPVAESQSASAADLGRLQTLAVVPAAGANRVAQIKMQLASAERQLASLQIARDGSRRTAVAAAAAGIASISAQLDTAQARLARLGQGQAAALRIANAKTPTEATTQSLAQVDGGGIMSGIIEGGQSYVDKLERQLLAAKSEASSAKRAVTAMRTPGAVVVPAGFAVAHSAPILAQLPYAAPPADAAAPTPVDGAGYVTGEGGGGAYSTIYGPFAAFGPMKRWAAEDSAEHAYTLSKWRESILKAKIKQAKLTRQLMDYEMHPPAAAAAGGENAAGGGARTGKLAAAGGDKVQREEKELKGMVLSVATETMQALRSLSSQVRALRAAPSGRRGRVGQPRDDTSHAAALALRGGGRGGPVGLRVYAEKELGRLESAVGRALRERRARRAARLRQLVRDTPATGVVSLQAREDRSRDLLPEFQARKARRLASQLSRDLALDRAARRVAAAVGGVR